MKNVTYILIVLTTGLLMACSDNKFSSLPTATCDAANASTNQSCVPGTSTNTYSISFHTGDVDILIVNDNSGSMYTEQTKMGTQFPNFINSISDLNFQLAMVTTDVSATAGNTVKKAANGYGAFQDGKFLDFGSGTKILKYNPTSSTAGADLNSISTKFYNTVRRQETLDCDYNDYDVNYCPGGDERGIYALNLAAERNEGSFFRPTAHLAVIILSDEDERSNSGAYPGVNDLEQKDLPETFLSTMQAKYPNKSITVHSVIIRPGDQSCLNAQVQTRNGKTTRGFYGNIYAQLTEPDVYGPSFLLNFSNLKYEYSQIGNICASDYGAQLGDIGDAVGAAATQPEFQLKCKPNANDIAIVTTPANVNLSYTIDASNKMIFSNVPAGVDAKITYKCSSNI